MLGVSVLLLSAPSTAAHVRDFKGETISIQIGFGPGGGYDLYGRVLARHYGRFIPGNPAVVAKNMPGARALRAANHIYNLKESVELGIFSAATAMEPLMGNDAAQFEASKFGWVGSMNQDISFCGIWQRPGAAASLLDLLRKDGPETIFGAAGPAAISYQHPLVLKNVMGAHLRVISGYGGRDDVMLGHDSFANLQMIFAYVRQKQINIDMQRGEIHGTCGLFVSSIKSHWLRDVQAGNFKLILQMGPKRTDAFGNVPSIFDFVKTDADRKLLKLYFKQTLLGRPIAASPNLSQERVAMLRKAFVETLKDADFLADARKIDLDIDPATGEQIEQLLVQFADYPPAVIARAKAAIGR